MANKRRMPRERRRLRVRIGEVMSFTQDVSPGGFCLEAMQVYPPGTELHGTIEIGPQAFAFTGQVRWAIAPERKINKRGRMGVMFNGIDNQFYVAYQNAFPKAGSPGQGTP